MMKKLILLLLLVFLIPTVLATFTTINQTSPNAYATLISTSVIFNWTAINSEFEGFNFSLSNETSFSGSFNESYNWTNATDGNLSTFALPAEGNTTFIFFNFTKIPGSQNTSVIQVKDTGETVNLSIDSACWEQVPKQIRANQSRLITKNSTETSCYNGSSWESLREETTGAELYDIRAWWDVTNHTDFYCDILAKNTTSYNNWGIIANDVRSSNSSANTTTVTLTDSTRYWWKAECEDDFSGVRGNSTTRIFDIDEIYMTFSFGAGEVINFTFDNGDIVAAGNITGNNFFGNNFFGNNFFGNGFNFSGGDLVISGNISVGDIITFRQGETIDNIDDGFIKMIGKVNITGNLTIDSTIRNEAGNITVDATESLVVGGTTKNITMQSIDGTWFNCGVADGGTFSCS